MSRRVLPQATTPQYVPPRNTPPVANRMPMPMPKPQQQVPRVSPVTQTFKSQTLLPPNTAGPSPSRPPGTRPVSSPPVPVVSGIRRSPLPQASRNTVTTPLYVPGEKHAEVAGGMRFTSDIVAVYESQGVSLAQVETKPQKRQLQEHAWRNTKRVVDETMSALKASNAAPDVRRVQEVMENDPQNNSLRSPEHYLRLEELCREARNSIHHDMQSLHKVPPPPVIPVTPPQPAIVIDVDSLPNPTPEPPKITVQEALQEGMMRTPKLNSALGSSYLHYIRSRG